MNDLMTNSFLSYVELKKQAKLDGKLEEIDLEKGVTEEEPKITQSDEVYLAKFFQEVEAIKSNMEEITNLLLDLQTLNEETKSAHSAKVLRGLRDRMESDMVAVLRKANVVRVRLECLDKNSDGGNSVSCVVERTKASVINGLRIKLKELMNNFQELRDKIVSDHKEYLKRRYYNETGEYPSEAMIETMVSGSGKVFEVLDGKMDLVLETKERHEAVNDIKRSLNKLHQLFLDMAVLVETQGQGLDNIEDNVAKAGSFVGGGTDSLFYAKQMKDKRSRHWVCLIWALVIILCAVVFIAVLSHL